MRAHQRKRDRTAFDMGSCFSGGKSEREDDMEPSATAGEGKGQGEAEKQQRESCAPEKRNGTIHCKCPSTEGVVIEDPTTQAGDKPVAYQPQHLEHRQIAEKPKDQAYPEADHCSGTSRNSKVLQDKSSLCRESQLEAPCESVTKLAGSEHIHVAAVEDVPGNTGLAADMRQDKRATLTDREGKAGEPASTGKQAKCTYRAAESYGADGSCSISRAKVSKLEAVKSEVSKKEKTKDPQEGLSGAGKTVPPQEITPGQDAGNDMARTDKGAQDNLVQSLVKGPTESADQSLPAPVDVKSEPMAAEGGIASIDDDTGEADLYRAAEEIEEERDRRSRVRERLSGDAASKDRCSVAQEVELLYYSEREWRGNTAKSTLIRKGYEVVARSFQGLRRVRGDNYCALRATLFQVLCHHPPPDWLQDRDITKWPELLGEDGLIKHWRLPLDLKEHGGFDSTTGCLKYYLNLLKKKWQQAAEACSALERQRMCEQVFQGGEVEYGLLEAVKLLMLCTAVELHSRMRRSDPVPDFCWLLFARDSSSCPRAFLTNHLSLVGFSGGLEQVEMFLLGYTLQSTIQVYRLYKAETEEFITYYPDDHKDDWLQVSLVTEDDRHYNIPVAVPDRRSSQEPPGVTSTSPAKLSL